MADTIDAGDLFDAGLLCGLSGGLDLPGALRLAVAVGTLSTRGVGGADGQPEADEADRFAAQVVVSHEE